MKRDEMRQALREVNTSLKTLLENANRYHSEDAKANLASVNEYIGRLRKSYGTGKNGLFALRYEKLTKSELENRLMQFQFVKEYLVENIGEYADKMQQHDIAAQQGFNEHFGTELDLATYKKVAGIISAVGERVLTQFGSNRVVSDVTKAVESGQDPKAIAKSLIQGLQETSGKGLSVDEAYKEIAKSLL